MGYIGNSIVDCLIKRTTRFPHKTVFITPENRDAAESSITYQELTSRVAALSIQLVEQQLAGKMALLVYQDVLAFIIAFLACQHAGVIAVPVPYVKGSKQFLRLTNIMEDAQAAVVLCTTASTGYLRQGLSDFLARHKTAVISTDLPLSSTTLPLKAEMIYNEIAFIQYTSGSTGKPKGVVITHQNLLHNQQLIKNTFGADEHAIIFSWLPFHHDMGLIGNLLHTLYVGCTGVLMSPFHFIQRPARWLEAITKYRVTHSGAPNFAYDLCVNKISQAELPLLNLSSWKVAYNGSEPVRFDTLQRFTNYFKPSGFHGHAFFPCYGLAEATLLVTGSKEIEAPPFTIFIDKRSVNTGKVKLTNSTAPYATPVVSAGGIADGMDVRVIAMPDTKVCEELEEGEICIAGESVTSGYWNKDNHGVFYELDGRSFLRTGDIGFLCNGLLFVHGRLKDMLIIRGGNFYPYDIEQMVAESVAAVEANGVAVFGMEDQEETFVIVAEIKRNFIREIVVEDIISAINSATIEATGIIPYDILLTTPLGIPRTTSGKLQRSKCRQHYGEGKFQVIGSKQVLVAEAPPKAEPAGYDGNVHTIRSYLVTLIEAKTGHLSAAHIKDSMELTTIGIDSLRAVELINTINRDLQINLDPAIVFQGNTLSGLIKNIENVLWLKNEQTSGEEIII
ncbi:AMP-binding protein [Chitinophaga sp. RAB17]|uniref:AMP-binding protein n=1 Tax=Chitinophaga sp. RAB17 TaxID=3233049 RepID=UPI003F93A9C1